VSGGLVSSELCCRGSERTVGLVSHESADVVVALGGGITAAMAEIAVAAGVPPGSITAETRSRDTIGNMWFTKPLLGGPSGQGVTVVTSDWHTARVRYLAQVIWGPGYQVTVEPLTGEADTRSPEEIARWEAGVLAVSRRWFAAVRPGDDTAIAAVLARDHPAYADHPQTTLAELAAMITRHTT